MLLGGGELELVGEQEQQAQGSYHEHPAADQAKGGASQTIRAGQEQAGRIEDFQTMFIGCRGQPSQPLRIPDHHLIATKTTDSWQIRARIDGVVIKIFAKTIRHSGQDLPLQN